MKTKRVYACTECGTTSPKWVGKCHACGSWNTYVEEVISRSDMADDKQRVWENPTGSARRADPVPVAVKDIEATEAMRMPTPDPELNRVLGGGIVPGSLVLIGGQPGIGKSTLLLQTAVQVGCKVLYVSGEESLEQIKMRAERIAPPGDHCFILTETNTSRILTQAQALQPELIIIDSIQTLASPHVESPPGSVSQVRECAAELQRFAKETNVPVFIIGHITKEGTIAGPKLLEHIVDTVLQFEGDQHYTYRVLRTHKNRFGSTEEIGIYEMQATGLRPVANPSELLISQNEEELSGSAIAATIEGLRPLLIETQALVTRAVYGNPQRSATGFDLRRMNMLLAVLEKRGGHPFGQQDVFLNIAGGIRVDDPATDLSVVAALLSSLEDVTIPQQICFAAEVGLSGEIRAVNRIEQRIQEAGRLGFASIFISKYNTKGLDLSKYPIRVIPIAKVEELHERLFV